jgi:hypothetical protein
MSQLPPDWKNEQKLWNALDTPTPKTSTNFNYAVRQRINELAMAKQRAHRFAYFESIFSIFRGWTGAIACATACITVGLVLWLTPHPATNEITSLPSKTSEPVELAHLAQNIDLIQDMDVIEHLDELAAN